MLITSRPGVPTTGTPLAAPGQAAPALAAADLGFRAFTERNQPRYTHYAAARIPLKPSVLTAVDATLAHACQHWDWLLSQPSLAADVWEELRYQVRRQADEAPPRDTEVATLYYSLPETSADSVLLCRRLGMDIQEAAELMGLEPSAVEAGLSVARRALPYLDAGRRI